MLELLAQGTVRTHYGAAYQCAQYWEVAAPRRVDFRLLMLRAPFLRHKVKADVEEVFQTNCETVSSRGGSRWRKKERGNE